MSAHQAGLSRFCTAHHDIESATTVRMSRSLRYGPAAVGPLYQKGRTKILALRGVSDIRREALLQRLDFVRTFLLKLMSSRLYRKRLGVTIYRAYLAMKEECRQRAEELKQTQLRPKLPVPTPLGTFYTTHGVNPPLALMREEGMLSEGEYAYN